MHAVSTTVYVSARIYIYSTCTWTCLFVCVHNKTYYVTSTLYTYWNVCTRYVFTGIRRVTIHWALPTPVWKTRTLSDCQLPTDQMCVRGGCARKIPAPCTHSTFLLKIRTRSLIFHIPPRTRPCVFCAVSATSARVGATRGERRFPPPVCALCALLSYIINSVHPTPPTQLAENRGRNVPGHTWCMAYLRGPPLLVLSYEA